MEGLQSSTEALQEYILVEELQELRLVFHHFLAPGMSFGTVKEIGSTAQLLLEHRPEGWFWTQNFKTMYPGVNTTLLREETVGRSEAENIIGSRM